MQQNSSSNIQNGIEFVELFQMLWPIQEYPGFRLVLDVYQINWKFKQKHRFTESKFIGILTTNLKDSIGLSDQEINELTDYFKVQNGQIAYAQFCSVIHDNGRSWWV